MSGWSEIFTYTSTYHILMSVLVGVGVLNYISIYRVIFICIYIETWATSPLDVWMADMYTYTCIYYIIMGELVGVGKLIYA